MSTTALAQASKSDLAAKANRLQAIVRNVREHSRTVMRRSTGVLVSGAGGFIAGVIDDRVPEVGGLPTAALVGVGLGLLGAVDGAGDQSDMLCALGGGILAGAAYGKGKEMSQEISRRAGA